MDLKSIFLDPEFRAMQPQEKVKVLTAADPEFGKLLPEDKMKVMISGLYPHIYDKAPEAHDNGFWNTIGNDLMRTPEGLYKLISGDPATYQALGRSHLDQAKQASFGSVEGLGHGLAALLPLIGPMAAQAGTEIGAGKTGEGFAHAAELLAPIVGPKAIRGAIEAAPKVINAIPHRGLPGVIMRGLGRDPIPPAAPPTPTPQPQYGTNIPLPPKTGPNLTVNPASTGGPGGSVTPPIGPGGRIPMGTANPPSRIPVSQTAPPNPAMGPRPNSVTPEAPPPQPMPTPTMGPRPNSVTPNAPPQPPPTMGPRPVSSTPPTGPGGLIPAGTVNPPSRIPIPPQNPTVLNTVKPPIMAPSTAPPPSGVPGTPSTTASTVLNTGKAQVAAEALKNELGGTPGQPLVIPGSDTTAAGNAIHEANSVAKSLREQGINESDFSKLSDPEKAQVREMVSKSDKSPQAKSMILDKLGVAPKEVTPLDTNVPGGPLPQFAKGGIVLSAKEAPSEMAHSGEDIKGDMGRSGIDIIRGSFDVPLSSKGKEQAEELAKRFKAKGGLDSIDVSNLHRAVQTAEAISKATDIPISNKAKDLRPWSLGSIEGQPTLKVLDKIHRYITKQPNVKVPGMGEKSTSPGESFIDFKRRTLGGLKKRLQVLKSDPSKRIGLVTHYRDLRLAQSWANKGFPDSMEINSKMMTEKGDDPPTSVHRIFWLGSSPKMQKVDMKSNGKLPGGLYLIRHGATALNGTDAKGTPI